MDGLQPKRRLNAVNQLRLHRQAACKSGMPAPVTRKKSSCRRSECRIMTWAEMACRGVTKMCCLDEWRLEIRMRLKSTPRMAWKNDLIRSSVNQV